MKRKFLKGIALSAITLFTFNSNIMAQQTLPAAQDPHLIKDIRGFLEALNSGDGKPLEQMSPKDARLVLVGAQKSVNYNYSDIEETEKTIIQDGLSIKIHIVKPKDAKTDLPVFMFFHGGG